MDLSDIIETYQGKLSESQDEATRFILGQMQGEKAHVFSRRFLGLFMCGEDGDGYDPINNKLYQVDPDIESLDFKPQNGQFILFEKKGKYAGPDTANLSEQDKLNFVQNLQVVGTEEVLQAHIYDPEQVIGKELMQVHYTEVVRIANMLTGI
ncbi:hypothetical protein CEE44_05310 [Candidatus Woesearchaeota archaeon B3_Woes]|nr:MAG: hypothetical protein CEE44_05310 [Candidatus Woesearchaeota archaeon B3_Woes]